MSIYGVYGSFGLAFNLIYPVPILPVDTITWDPEYDCALLAISPNELESAPIGAEPLYPLVT